MCGRYGLFPPPEEIARFFGVTPDFEYAPHFNIAPSQKALVALASGSGPRLGPLRWGFHVGNASKGRHMINARAETVHSSPAFRTAFARRRCIVPASGFYEWRRNEDGKVPYWIHPQPGSLLLMAGIWGRDPELHGTEVRRTGDAGYAVLTRDANPEVSSIHNRMPVMLSEEGARMWLDKEATTQALRESMRDSVVALSAHSVSPLVNRAANDLPECIRPTEEPLF